MYIEKGINRLHFFGSLYESAKSALSPLLETLRAHYEQYKGSDEIDGSTERASAVRNITYELIESQIHSDIPAPRVDAKRYSHRHERNAINVERLCQKIRDELPFEEHNDIDERYTYIYGGSIWLVEWDSEREEAGERGGVKLSCISPRDFFPQPNIYKLEDMEYCFLRFITTRDELCRRWGVSRERIEEADTELEAESRSDDDVVTVIACFYRNEEGEVSQFVWSGELVLADLDNYYRRKNCICASCKQELSFCTCGKQKKLLTDALEESLTHDVVRGDGSVISCRDASGETVRLPYYVPKSFPLVIRRNTSGDKQLLGQSDCEFLRPEQQKINKVESRIMQKLMRAGITPLVPEDATITVNNAIFGQVIRLRPGESAASYGTVDTTPDISQDIAQAERLYAHAKRIIGVSDAYQGIEFNQNESGYARQIRVQQAAGRLESKRRMKYTAYAEMDKIIFAYYLAYADEPRLISYTDCYGKKHPATFNRYDFLEQDPATGKYFYDDGYLFSVDLSFAGGQTREQMWEENLKNLKSGTLGDPTQDATLLRYWQNQERAHYPHARENVEYFIERIKRGERAYDQEKEEPKAEAISSSTP